VRNALVRIVMIAPLCDASDLMPCHRYGLPF
jgi:hypothetical protein